MLLRRRKRIYFETRPNEVAERGGSSRAHPALTTLQWSPSRHEENQALSLKDIVVNVALSQNDTIYTLLESDIWNLVLPMARDIMLKRMGPDSYKRRQRIISCTRRWREDSEHFAISNTINMTSGYVINSWR